MAPREITDRYLPRSGVQMSTGPRSAETEALDRVPDGHVAAALRELAEDIRMAVYLADVEGLAYQEIADVMRTPVGTVVSRLHRGRRQLRSCSASGKWRRPERHRPRQVDRRCVEQIRATGARLDAGRPVAAGGYRTYRSTADQEGCCPRRRRMPSA